MKERVPFRSTVKKCLLAGGVPRVNRTVVDYLIRRLNNEIKRRSKRSFLFSRRKRIDLKAVLAAAEVDGLGKLTVNNDVFRVVRHRVKKHVVE